MMAADFPEGFDPVEKDKQVWQIVAWVSLGVFLFVFLFTLVMIRRIRIAVACLKVNAPLLACMRPHRHRFPFRAQSFHVSAPFVHFHPLPKRIRAIAKVHLGLALPHRPALSVHPSIFYRTAFTTT